MLCRYNFILFVLLLAYPIAGLTAHLHNDLVVNGPRFDPLEGDWDDVVAVSVFETNPIQNSVDHEIAQLFIDDEGRTEKHVTRGSAPAESTSIHVVKFDHSGDRIEERTKDARGLTLERRVFLYDDKGRLSQESSFIQQDTLESALVFLYTGDLLSEIAVFDPDGRPRWRRVYDYPDAGTVEWSVLYADGRFQQAGRLLYDETGILSEQHTLNEHDQLTEKRVFSHDEHGRLRQIKTFNSHEELLEQRSYHYDKHGNLERRIIEDSTGSPVSITSYNYTYDRHANWTQVEILGVEARLERPFEVEHRVLRRNITYRSETN